MLVNAALEAFAAMRKRNDDVFYAPHIDQSFLYTSEELHELWRVKQHTEENHLRTHALDADAEYKKHLEWGQCMMMLATIAQQMNIDGDKAIEIAIQHTDEKCHRKRHAES